MSRIVYDDDAHQEVVDGMDYYDGQQPGLGFDFYQELQGVVARVVQSPRIFPEFRRSGRRKARLKRFPYTVYFTELPDGIWIAAVRGDGQNDSWLTRQPPTDPA